MAGLRVLYSFPLRVGHVGIGTTAWSQVDGLVRQGVQVHLSCGSLSRPVDGLAGSDETYMVAGRRIPISPLGIRLAARLHDRLTARRLASGRFRPDVIHGWPLGSEETFRVAKRLGIPTFLERPNTHTGYAYEVVLEEYRRLGIPQPATMTHKMDAQRLAVELREYDLASYLLCPSEFVMNTFTDRGTDPAKLLRTQYGYDPRRFSPGPGRSESTDGLTLVFAGSVEPRKGLHYALDAWLASSARTSGVLRICGAFTPGYAEVLGRRLEHPSVEVPGYTDDLCAEFRRSDALVLSSIEEGSALVTYEAMACGAALLVSRAAGAPVQHGCEGLVHEVRAQDQLREHIDLLHRDQRRLRQMQSNAAAAARLLTWSDAARVLLQAYHAGTGRIG